jgi:hypothetical protein
MKDNNQTQNSTSQNPREEEIDLGHIFLIIGRGFSNLFSFIGSIFKTIFTWFLSLLLFLRRNFKLLVLGALLGAILGGVYEFVVKTPTYESSMTVEPNFGSAVQLYKNIDFYQSLVKQKDAERLASSLNISKEEAANITLVTAEPYANKNQILLAYKNFISDLDSSTVKMIDYETFAKEQPVESFRYHIVTIQSKDKYIFNKLPIPIISSIIQNTYYDKVKSTSFSNLISKKNALTSSMSELDSLKALYKEVMLAESKKVNSGTNIFMSNTNESDKEVVVFDKYMVMNDEMIRVNKQLTEENEVINIVSSFNPVGMRIRGWYRNGTALGFLGGLGFVLLFSTVKELNRLLSIYESNRKLP